MAGDTLGKPQPQSAVDSFDSQSQDEVAKLELNKDRFGSCEIYRKSHLETNGFKYSDWHTPDKASIKNKSETIVWIT